MAIWGTIVLALQHFFLVIHKSVGGGPLEMFFETNLFHITSCNLCSLWGQCTPSGTCWAHALVITPTPVCTCFAREKDSRWIRTFSFPHHHAIFCLRFVLTLCLGSLFLNEVCMRWLTECHIQQDFLCLASMRSSLFGHTAGKVKKTNVKPCSGPATAFKMQENESLIIKRVRH